MVGALGRLHLEPVFAGLTRGSAVGGPRKAAVLHTWVGQCTAYSDTPRQSCLQTLRGCSCVRGFRGHGVLLSTFVLNVFHFAELVKSSLYIWNVACGVVIYTKQISAVYAFIQ